MEVVSSHPGAYYLDVLGRLVLSLQAHLPTSVLELVADVWLLLFFYTLGCIVSKG